MPEGPTFAVWGVYQFHHAHTGASELHGTHTLCDACATTRKNIGAS
jgi:hypothetical protein